MASILPLNQITQPLSLPAFKNKNSYILKNITIFAKTNISNNEKR